MIGEAKADDAVQRIHHDLGKLLTVGGQLPLKIWKDVVVLQQRIRELEELVEDRDA